MNSLTEPSELIPSYVVPSVLKVIIVFSLFTVCFLLILFNVAIGKM